MLSPLSFELLPSGSPDTFRYRPVAPSEESYQVQTPVRRTANRYYGNFPYRVISNRSGSPSSPRSPSSPFGDHSRAKQRLFSPNLSSDNEEIELPNFEISPVKIQEKRAEQAENEDQKLSYIAKTIAVQVLGKYSKRHGEVKNLLDNIYASFFQGFDNWRRDAYKEKKRKTDMNGEKENLLLEKANEKLKAAELKIRSMEREMEKWSETQVREISRNVPSVGELKSPLREKSVVDEGLKKIEDIIFELDKLQERLQENQAKCITIQRNSTEIAEMLRQKIQKPVNIRNLLI